MEEENNNSLGDILMIFIYDFDGTLTPYSLPQYPILKYCGYSDDILIKRVNSLMEYGVDFYTAYYRCYQTILAEGNINMTRENICLGAECTKFNNGVIDYFERFQSSKTGIKHYIVTSGIKDYVDKTPIRGLVDGVYGVTFKEENGEFKGIDFLLSDKRKVDVIKQIQQANNGTNQIVYFGDGFTDKDAFEYVHSIGGKNIFIASNPNSKQVYQTMNKDGIIDIIFNPDFSLKSMISKYVQTTFAPQYDEPEF